MRFKKICNRAVRLEICERFIKLTFCVAVGLIKRSVLLFSFVINVILFYKLQVGIEGKLRICDEESGGIGRSLYRDRLFAPSRHSFSDSTNSRSAL